MVGIRGSIPNNENDIRLSNIVVWLPTRQHRDVIQYNLGKIKDNGFRRLRRLDKPLILLRTAIATLRSARGVKKEISGLVIKRSSMMKTTMKSGHTLQLQKTFCSRQHSIMSRKVLPVLSVLKILLRLLQLGSSLPELFWIRLHKVWGIMYYNSIETKLLDSLLHRI